MDDLRIAIQRELETHQACIPAPSNSAERVSEVIGFHRGLHWVLGLLASPLPVCVSEVKKSPREIPRPRFTADLDGDDSTASPLHAGAEPEELNIAPIEFWLNEPLQSKYVKTVFRVIAESHIETLLAEVKRLRAALLSSRTAPEGPKP